MIVHTLKMCTDDAGPDQSRFCYCLFLHPYPFFVFVSSEASYVTAVSSEPPLLLL